MKRIKKRRPERGGGGETQSKNWRGKINQHASIAISACSYSKIRGLFYEVGD
jgi:hypothetical protein